MSSPWVEEDDDVRVRRLRLDEVGGEIDAAERDEVAADPFAAERRDRLDHAGLERVAEGVIGRDVIEFLAVFLDQRAGDRVRLHLRRVADAEDVPVAARCR